MQLNRFLYLFLWSVCVCFAKELEVTKLMEEYKNAFMNGSIIFKGSRNFIKYKDGVMILFCEALHYLSESFQPLEEFPVKFISFEGCKFSTTSIKQELLKLNIKTDNIDTLEISTTENTILQPGNYMSGLNLKRLIITAPSSRNYLIENPDFLAPLMNLTLLQIDGTNLPPIPSYISLKTLSLIRSNLTTVKWGNCENLQELNIVGDFKSPVNIPKAWKEKCNKIKALKLLDFIDISFVNNINTNYLQYINMENCNLLKIPKDILWNARNTLTHSIFYRNKLDETSLKDFIDLPNLTHLDLSYNKLDGTNFHDWTKHFKNLKHLNLDTNDFDNSFCRLVSQNSREITTSLKLLEYLSLNEMPKMNLNCLKSLHLAKLKYLGFSSKTKSSKIKLQEIVGTNSSELFVNLKDRSITGIEFELEDYIALYNKSYEEFWKTNFYKTANINLTLSGAEIDCDCENYWLAIAARQSLKFPFNLTLDFKCHTGVDFVKEGTEIMDCSKIDDIDTNCVLRFLGTWGSPRQKLGHLKMDCHNNEENFEYPYFSRKMYKLISLNVSDNQITTLQDVVMDNSLKWIDLRGNNIARLNKNDTDRLFASKDRRVWLSRNQIICDCENKYLIDALHENHDQVEDFANIICIDSNWPLADITSYEVCQIGLKILLGVLAALLVLAVIASAFIWRYRFQIKIYLYSRGLCLSCLREEDLDAERPFDAFLSFAHGDEAYVAEYLLPKLEGNPDNYRILIHFRDWVIGDWIPAQIMKSIQLSKRTIIVLSRNFVGSMWGSLEFKYAVASAAQEGRRRLLVLILDDVLTLPLDPELKAYIEYNTYLTCDDPWFWEKLRYAMPHRKDERNKPMESQTFHHVPQNENMVSQIEQVMMQSL